MFQTIQCNVCLFTGSSWIINVTVDWIQPEDYLIETDTTASAISNLCCALLFTVCECLPDHQGKRLKPLHKVFLLSVLHHHYIKLQHQNAHTTSHTNTKFRKPFPHYLHHKKGSGSLPGPSMLWLRAVVAHLSAEKKKRFSGESLPKWIVYCFPSVSLCVLWSDWDACWLEASE